MPGDPPRSLGHDGGQGAGGGGEHLTREQKLELWRRSKGKGPAPVGAKDAPSQSRTRLLKPLSSSQANARPAPRPSSTPPLGREARWEGGPSRTPEGTPRTPAEPSGAAGVQGGAAAPAPEDAARAAASHSGASPQAFSVEIPSSSSSTLHAEGAPPSDEACSHASSPEPPAPASPARAVSNRQAESPNFQDPQPAAPARPTQGAQAQDRQVLLGAQDRQVLLGGLGVGGDDDEEGEVSKEDLQVQLFDTSNRLAQCTALLQRMVEENGQLRSKLNEMSALQEKCAMLESTVVELRVLHDSAPHSFEAAQPSEVARGQLDARGSSKRAKTEGSECSEGGGGDGEAGGSSWAEREMGEVSRLRLTLAAQQKEYMEERQRHIEKMMKSEQRARAAESAVADVNLEWQQLFDSQMKTLQEQLKVALEQKRDSNAP